MVISNSSLFICAIVGLTLNVVVDMLLSFFGAFPFSGLVVVVLTFFVVFLVPKSIPNFLVIVFFKGLPLYSMSMSGAGMFGYLFSFLGILWCARCTFICVTLLPFGMLHRQSLSVSLAGLFGEPFLPWNALSL